MPEAGTFVDTNVFVYLFDEAEPVKRERARTTIEEHRRSIVVSTQVLIELHAVCTRRLDMSRNAAADAVATVARFPVVAADRDLILTATAIADRRQLSIFDSAILAAAVRARCVALLSEDLAGGSELEGVTIRNPFAGVD